MKEKNRRKEEKGITLLALIITIIVLIVLAGVTINSIIQINMIDKALSAVEEYEKEQQREDDMMSSIDSMLAEIETGDRTTNTPPVEETVPKVEVGEEAEEQGTISGEKGNYTNPTIPVGYIAINTDNAKWDAEDRARI